MEGFELTTGNSIIKVGTVDTSWSSIGQSPGLLRLKSHVYKTEVRPNLLYVPNIGRNDKRLKYI